MDLIARIAVAALLTPLAACSSDGPGDLSPDDLVGIQFAPSDGSIDSSLLDAQRLVSAVPVEIHVAPSGKSIVVTRPIEPTSLGELRRTTPEYAPLYSVTEAGGRSLGVMCRNDTGGPMLPNVRYPGLVVLLPSGKWVVDEVWFTIADGGLAPGEEMLIPGSERARLAIGLDSDGERLAQWAPPPSHGAP